MTLDLLDPAVVRVRDATVRFGSTPALERVSLSVDAGRVLAIVGANGAGKSTLFRAITGLVALDEGEAELFGFSASELPREVRARVAYVPESHAEVATATVRELASFRRALYRSFDDALFAELCGPARVSPSARFGALSRGQRALTVVGLALAQAPDLLLLDDPTLGLDPLARRTVVQSVLSTARQRATTVVIATHEIADVERLADDVLLLSRGRVASEAEDVGEFVARAAAVHLPLEVDRAAVAQVASVVHAWPRRDHLEVILSGSMSERDAARCALARIAGSAPESLTSMPISLEEATLAWLASDRAQERAPHA
jgi:ABC-2 type transport system ATP-binding protein